MQSFSLKVDETFVTLHQAQLLMEESQIKIGKSRHNDRLACLAQYIAFILYFLAGMHCILL